MAVNGPTRRTAILAAMGAAAATALPAHTARAQSARPPKAPPVLAGDQATRSVLLLDPAKQTWDLAADPAAALWRFSPEGREAYADLQPEVSWTYVSEVKAKRHYGRTFVMATASFGFCAVVEYPTGRRYWGTALNPGTDTINPHSIELLPNGNVAVAASTGGIVRVYAASQGPDSAVYAEAPLRTAHGVQWDGDRDWLWALGHDELVAYEVGGTRARPALTQVFATPLPGSDGHDLTQVTGNPDRLWVSINNNLYQYSKRRDAFLQDYPWTPGASRVHVKSATLHPRTGRVATTQPEPGLRETWQTEHVLVHPSGEPYYLVDGGIYKARWWQP